MSDSYNIVVFTNDYGNSTTFAEVNYTLVSSESGLYTYNSDPNQTFIPVNSFSGNINLVNFTCANTVTSIINAAFANCSNLTNVNLGNSLQGIGNYGFQGTGITNVNIPVSVTNISRQAFNSCSNLTGVTFNSTTIPMEIVDQNIFDLSTGGPNINCKVYVPSPLDTDNTLKLTNNGILLENIIMSAYNIAVFNAAGYAGLGSEFVDFNGVNYTYQTDTIYNYYSTSGNPQTIVGNYAFNFTFNPQQNQNFRYLTDFTLGTSVTSIGMYAFAGCVNVTSFNTNSTLKSISIGALSGCKFSSIDFPNTLTNIGQNAFSNNPSLTSIVIPSTIKTLGGAVFNSCSKLNSVSIENDNTSGEMFKLCTSLTNVILGDALTSLGARSFYGCSSLKNITFPENLNSIYGLCFSGTGLESITVPPSLTNAGLFAFADCKKLTNVLLQNNTIFNNMFEGCSSLTNVDIGDNVTLIDNNAFIRCVSLSSISIPDSVTSLGAGVFSNCSSLTNINFPNSLKNIGSYAFDACNALTNITLPSSLTVVSSYMFRDCTSLTTVNLGDSLTSIDGRAFLECISLTNIIFPENLNTLSEYCFSGSGLESITVPSTLINMGSYAFGGCRKLKNIVLQNNNISYKMFNGCSSLTYVEIGENVVNIVSHGFYGCSSLSTITIPKTVSGMGPYVFANCSSLTSLIFSSHNLPSLDPNVFTGSPTQQLIVYVPAYYKKINEYNKAKLVSLGILPDNIVFTSSTCFLTGSKILTDKGYIPIEDLRKGHMVKTLKNDYLPIVLIGKSVIHNYGDDKRIVDRLYKLTPDKYPELTEDLVITGNHSILVDTLTPFQKEQILASYGEFPITDDKVRLEAYLDDKALPYEEKGLFVTYHLALENKNNSYNYGIWANGLLVETCSKRYLLLISGMELIE